VPDFADYQRNIANVKAAKAVWEKAVQAGEHQTEKARRCDYQRTIGQARLAGFTDDEIANGWTSRPLR